MNWNTILNSWQYISGSTVIEKFSNSIGTLSMSAFTVLLSAFYLNASLLILLASPALSILSVLAQLGHNDPIRFSDLKHQIPRCNGHSAPHICHCIEINMQSICICGNFHYFIWMISQ